MRPPGGRPEDADELPAAGHRPGDVPSRRGSRPSAEARARSLPVSAVSEPVPDQTAAGGPAPAGRPARMTWHEIRAAVSAAAARPANCSSRGEAAPGRGCARTRVSVPQLHTFIFLPALHPSPAGQAPRLVLFPIALRLSAAGELAAAQLPNTARRFGTFAAMGRNARRTGQSVGPGSRFRVKSLTAVSRTRRPTRTQPDRPDWEALGLSGVIRLTPRRRRVGGDGTSEAQACHSRKHRRWAITPKKNHAISSRCCTRLLDCCCRPSTFVFIQGSNRLV